MIRQSEGKAPRAFFRSFYAFVGVLILLQAGASAIAGSDWTKYTQVPFDAAYSKYVSGFTFNGMMWVYGYNAQWDLETFSTSDGVSWTPAIMPTNIPAWSCNGQLWTSDFGYSSFDGTAWTQTPYPAPSDSLTVAVFNGRLWALGGSVVFGHGIDEVYWEDISRVSFSPDGQSPWSSYEAPWPPRDGHSAIVFNGKLWILGGVYSYYDGSAPRERWCYHDVWFTEDGQNWTQAPDAPWAPREWHSTVVADGKMWILGGVDGVHNVYMNDVWCTSDGSHWTQVTAAAPWQPRNEFSCLVYKNKIWVVGGYAPGGYLNDIWYTDIPSAIIGADPAPPNGWYPAGQSLNLTVTATGFNGDLTYQWHKDGEVITDATDAVYQVSQLGTSDTGAYTCDVIDTAASSATAGPVQITVYEGKLPVGGAGLAAMLAAGLAVAFLAVRGRVVRP